MRLKIKLNLEKLEIRKNSLTVLSLINKFLGDNNEYHDLKEKDYSVSMIMGGKKEDGIIYFNNDAHIFFSTENTKIIITVLNNIIGHYDFEEVKYNIRKGENILHASNVRYHSKGKTHFITEENKKNFEDYVKLKYNINIEVLNINAHIDIKYKNNSAIKSSNILFKLKVNDIEKDSKIFNLGIGGTTAQGFGFVSNVKTKETI